MAALGDTPLQNGQTMAELAEGEREHFGDPDKRSGIYAAPGTGGNLRDYFAANAPEIPAWFHRDWVTKVVDLGSGRKGPRRIEEDVANHFFRWRWHYADQMLKARQS